MTQKQQQQQQQQIRNKVFETNSSSTHSITLSEDYENILMDRLYVDAIGEVSLYGGEYGWEYEEYNDAETKANYIALYAKVYSKHKYRNMELLKKVIIEQTGATNVRFDFSEKNAYIDHQSVENYDYEWLFEDDGEQLRQFIFNRNSYLITDNDNH